MTDIIIKTKRITKKRDNLDHEMHYNYASEVCKIRQKFSELLKDNKEEAYKFACENAKKEKELLAKGTYINENLFKMQDKLLKYDKQISDLSKEICLYERIKK